MASKLTRSVLKNQQERKMRTASFESSGSFENMNYHRRGEVAIPTSDTPSTYSGGTSFSWRVLWAYTGPGWLMSIAFLDPGNLESDLQAGAYANYQLLSVLFWSTAAGLLLQILAARLGVVTGKHLAEICREEYPAPLSFTLWVMTEIAIIGSDIQEVVGSAIAFQILFGFPLWVGCLVTGLDTFTFLTLHHFGIRRLEAFFGALIAIMVICFFANFAFVQPPLGSILERTFVPHVESYAAVQAVGIIGAIIMPHNIYLHSALVQTRQVDRSDSAALSEANKYFSIEAALALGTSFLVNLAVVAVFAKGFFDPACAKQGLACVPSSADHPGVAAAAVAGGAHAAAQWTSSGTMYCESQMGVPGSCGSIGLEGAGDALHGLLGGSARFVWAIGLLAAGQSSTMTGTYAGQFVMQGFLNLEIAPWMRVAVTRSVALGPAIGVVLYGARGAGQRGSDSALNGLDEWLNVLQSVQLPFALLPLLHFTSSPRLMGTFRTSKGWAGAAWAIAGSVLCTNFYLVFTQTEPFWVGGGQGVLCFAVAPVVLYIGLLLLLMYFAPGKEDRRDSFSRTGQI